MIHKLSISVVCIVSLLLVISGCGNSTNSGITSSESSTGTDGIVISFVEGAPQSSYLVGDTDEPVAIILELANKGAWPETDDGNSIDRGKVYLSGFDDDIIVLNDHSKIFNREFMYGKSNLNPNGGFDTAEFKGYIRPNDLVIDKYTPTILATACFPYVTKASPTVCIDPNPFDTKREKVCKVGSQNTGSQGAPVAVTRVDMDASSTKTQFKITIKNVGGGDVLQLNELDRCNPRTHGSDPLKREHFDKIELVRASVGAAELQCGPFAFGREIRLSNGEGFIICSIEKDYYNDAQDAYTTPLNIELSYGYRKTVSKPIVVNKISSIN